MHIFNYGYSVPRLNRGSESTKSFYLAKILYRNLPEEIKGAESGSAAVFRHISCGPVAV